MHETAFFTPEKCQVFFKMKELDRFYQYLIEWKTSGDIELRIRNSNISLQARLHHVFW